MKDLIGDGWVLAVEVVQDWRRVAKSEVDHHEKQSNAKCKCCQYEGNFHPKQKVGYTISNYAALDQQREEKSYGQH